VAFDEKKSLYWSGFWAKVAVKGPLTPATRGQFGSFNMIISAIPDRYVRRATLDEGARLSQRRPQIAVTEFNPFWGTGP
jgi:hypothetical protein